jgi:hypothetical protein
MGACALLLVYVLTQPLPGGHGILGIALEQTALEEVPALLGPNPLQHSGSDAAETVHFHCYTGLDGTTLVLSSLELSGGRVGSFQLRRERDRSSLGQCTSARALSRRTTTTSGLRLGLTSRDAVAMLGRPAVDASNLMVWTRDTRLDRTWTRSETVNARFEDDALAEVEVTQLTHE